MFPKLIFTILMTFATAVLYSQQVVRGVVLSADNKPLKGASVVLVEKPTKGTMTDSMGRYELTLPDKQLYSLKVSYLGYISESKQMTKGNYTLNFRLDEDLLDMSTVVVTGTKSPKMLKDVPIATRVISARDIQKSDATHIGELLEIEMPGIEFSYSMNQQQSLNMQGFGGNSVLFLVDGERLAGETLDNIDYSRLTMSNVNRVEIVKGAASSLYGSNAVGGVVNLITTPNANYERPWWINVNSRVGEHNQWRNGLSFGVNRNIYSGVISFQHTSADEIKLKNPGDYDRIYGYKTFSLNHKSGIDICDRLKLTARLGTYFRERQNSQELAERYRDFNAGIKAAYSLGDDKLELSYSFDQYDKSDYLKLNRLDIRDYSNVQHIVKSLYNNTLGEDKILTLGCDFVRDYLLSYQFSADESHSQYTADFFAQFDWKLSEQLNIIAGVRYDYYSKSDADNISPKIAAMYRMGDWALRGAYSGGFRAPSLKELFMNFDMANIFTIYGNSKLKSEVSHNFSLSAEYSKQRFNFTLSGFHSIVDNRITTAWSQQLKGMLYTNLDRVNVSGIEANVMSRFACGVLARLSYVYTHEYVGNNSLLISTTRPHSAVLRLEYDRFISNNYSFNVSLYGRYMSGVNATEYQFASINQTVERKYPEYTMWRFTVNNKILNGINVSMTIDNLFNYIPSYYYNNSPMSIGRTVSVGLSVNVDRLWNKQ